MKTITEFAVSTLKNALKTKQELLTAGKTAEELPAAMGEALKLEGDKLTFLLSALEVIEKKSEDLKRVVVLSLQEGEKAPQNTQQKGEHYFAVEYFPPMPGQQRKDRRPGGPGGPGGPRGKGRGKGRDRDGKRGERGGRGRRDEGAQSTAGAGPKPEGAEGAAGEKRRPRRQWKPRGPAAGVQAGEAKTPSAPLKPIQPKGSAPSNSTPPTSST